MTIIKIFNSDDLGAVLDAPPLTAQDAADTPLDWDGIWVNGTLYEIDREASSPTLAVLANGTAAVKLSPKGKICWYDHGNWPGVGRYSESEHWCPARVKYHYVAGTDIVIRLDWRAVTISDEVTIDTEVYPTLEEAEAAFEKAIAEQESWAEENCRYHEDEDED